MKRRDQGRPSVHGCKDLELGLEIMADILWVIFLNAFASILYFFIIMYCYVLVHEITYLVILVCALFSCVKSLHEIMLLWSRMHISLLVFRCTPTTKPLYWGVCA